MPPGFVPPPGWLPDPAWGEPPAGWPIWVDDQQSPRRWLTWRRFVQTGVIAFVVAIVVVAVTAHDRADKAQGAHRVIYTVTGDGSANNVTYLVAGGEQQANSVSLPWSYEAQLSARASGAAVVVTAQRASGDDGGSISCDISVDGSSVVHNTSSGQYAVVTCSAPLS